MAWTSARCGLGQAPYGLGKCPIQQPGSGHGKRTASKLGMRPVTLRRISQHPPVTSKLGLSSRLALPAHFHRQPGFLMCGLLTLLKYPYPNLNLTLIQKLKLSVKLDSYSDFRRLNKSSTSCRVPNKCMTLGYSNTAVYVVYAHNAKCTWTDGYRESLKPCKKTTKCCTKWRL